MSARIAANLLRARRFLPLLGAQLFGAFNDQFLKNAMIALVTWGGMSLWGLETKTAVPLAGLLFTLPFFLLSSLAGQIADKHDKALVLRKVKFAEIFIMIFAAIGLILQNPTLLILALMAMGAQSAFFGPSKNAALPQWLSDKELLTGNAVISGLLYVLIMVGQILGTLLILRAGGEYIVAVTLVLFAVLGWLSMRKALPAPSPNPDLKIDYNIVFDTFRNLAFAFKDLPVLRPMLGTAWYYGLSAAVLIIMPAYIEGVLHYNAQVFILTMISFVIGAALGALAITILAKGRDAVGLAAIAAFGIILFSLDLYFSAGINAFTKFDPLVLGAGGKPELGTVADFFSNSATPRFLIGLVGAAMSASMFVVPMNTMAQRRANPMQRARLLAAGSIMLNAATTGVQGLVFLMTLTVLPMQTPFLIIALCTIPIALYSSYRAWILRKTPAPTGAE